MLTVCQACTRRATESMSRCADQAYHVPVMLSGVRRRAWAGRLAMGQACNAGVRQRACASAPTGCQACTGGLACATTRVLWLGKKFSCLNIPAAAHQVYGGFIKSHLERDIQALGRQTKTTKRHAAFRGVGINMSSVDTKNHPLSLKIPQVRRINT